METELFRKFQVVADEVSEKCEYITAGKVYVMTCAVDAPDFNTDKSVHGGMIIDDTEDSIYIAVKRCAHLNHGSGENGWRILAEIV